MDVYSIFESYGFFHFIGPFLVVFSLIYGSLRKVGLFGKAKNAEKIYVIISLSIAFYYIYSIATVEYTQKVLSFFFYEILALFFILIILGLLYNSVKSDVEGKARPNILASLLILTVVFAFLYASVSRPEEMGSTIENVFNIIFESDLFIILFMLGLIIIIAAWVTSSGKTKPTQKTKSILVTTDATLDDLFKRLSK